MNIWHEIAIAFCLLLVFEGIIPFLYPQKWRHWVKRIENISNQHLRLSGLFLMLAGAGLMYLLR